MSFATLPLSWINAAAVFVQQRCVSEHARESGQNREAIYRDARHFDLFPNLEHAVTDAGSGLLKGLRLSSAKRQAAGQPGIGHSLDVFHTKHEGWRAWRVTESRLWKAQKQAEDLWRPLKKRQQQGLSIQSLTQRAHAASREAERRLDAAIEIETAWREVCSALEWFTPDDERNTSAAARAKLNEWLPQLRGREWEKTVRLLSRSQQRRSALKTDCFYGKTELRETSIPL